MPVGTKGKGVHSQERNRIKNPVLGQHAKCAYSVLPMRKINRTREPHINNRNPFVKRYGGRGERRVDKIRAMQRRVSARMPLGDDRLISRALETTPAFHFSSALRFVQCFTLPVHACTSENNNGKVLMKCQQVSYHFSFFCLPPHEITVRIIENIITPFIRRKPSAVTLPFPLPLP